ncbi:hypothetical protein RhiirA4_64397 [Rhizophagus irregularis]|uniref:Uncharacterized protein n=1 Tax=Rhizophagus irregularis TaxID=588596 RepID=A0A2I1H7D8_9GLOM|nr:hypothetical protein RhiirA4_64397 [Rhizophagus irregularis]
MSISLFLKKERKHNNNARKKSLCNFYSIIIILSQIFNNICRFFMFYTLSFRKKVFYNIAYQMFFQ